jgi:hypothetical protein
LGKNQDSGELVDNRDMVNSRSLYVIPVEQEEPVPASARECRCAPSHRIWFPFWSEPVLFAPDQTLDVGTMGEEIRTASRTVIQSRMAGISG